MEILHGVQADRPAGTPEPDGTFALADCSDQMFFADLALHSHWKICVDRATARGCIDLARVMLRHSEVDTAGACLQVCFQCRRGGLGTERLSLIFRLLEIDLPSNITFLKPGGKYYFRVGALIDAAQAKLNYAPAVRIEI